MNGLFGLALSNTDISGNINVLDNNLNNLTYLDLSELHLKGMVPFLPNIEYLDLSNNCLDMNTETANNYKSTPIYKNNTEHKESMLDFYKDSYYYLNLNSNCIDLNTIKDFKGLTKSDCTGCNGQKGITSIQILSNSLIINYK